MDNLRGATIMVLAMLGFAVEDMFIKLLAGSLPIGQIIGLMATGGGRNLCIDLPRSRVGPVLLATCSRPPF